MPIPPDKLIGLASGVIAPLFDSSHALERQSATLAAVRDAAPEAPHRRDPRWSGPENRRGGGVIQADDSPDGGTTYDYNCDGCPAYFRLADLLPNSEEAIWAA